MMDTLFLGIELEGAIKGILSFGHLVGLVLGLGTTAYLDGGCFLSILRGSWNGYRFFMSGTLFAIATKFVIIGLALLWVTGCGFLLHYSVFDPGKLANPKLYAKLAVVVVLTVNGYALHHLVLKRVVAMDGCDQLLRTKVGPLCLFSGAVSSASWIGAFLLGALPMLNHGVAFAVFVVVWAALVLVLYLTARMAVVRARRNQPGEPMVLPDTIGSRDLRAILLDPSPVHAIPAMGQGSATASPSGRSDGRPRPRAPHPSKASLPA